VPAPGTAGVPRAAPDPVGGIAARGRDQAPRSGREASAAPTPRPDVTTLRPRDWGGALIALAAAALFVRLGIWQVHRLSQRRARNAVIAARRALPPLVVEGRPEVAEPDALAD